jgi:hypothetical protein
MNERDKKRPPENKQNQICRLIRAKAYEYIIDEFDTTN